MNNINTMSKQKYITEHIFCVIAAIILYKALLFKNIGSLSRTESTIALWTILLTMIIIGIAMTWYRRRNYVSVFANVILPFGVYALISYSQSVPVLCKIALIIASVLCAAYCWLVLSQKISKKKPRKEIIKRRISYCLLGSKTIVSLCLSLAIVAIGISVIFQHYQNTPNIGAEISTIDSKWTIENNIDTVTNFQQDKWAKLTTKEKLNTLQTVANIEANYLGLPHELKVRLDVLDDGTFAEYYDKEHTITLNSFNFDSSKASDELNGLCHEAYHAYQHRLCDAYESVDETYRGLLVFYDVRKYKAEFSDYNDGTEDYVSYYLQKCESNSREYAKVAVADYYDRIEEHISNTEQTTTQEETDKAS